MTTDYLKRRWQERKAAAEAFFDGFERSDTQITVDPETGFFRFHSPSLAWLERATHVYQEQPWPRAHRNHY